MSWEDFAVSMCGDYDGRPCDGRSLVFPICPQHMMGLPIHQAVDHNIAHRCCMCHLQDQMYNAGRSELLCEMSYAGEWPVGTLQPGQRGDMPPSDPHSMKAAVHAECRRVGRELTELEAMQLAAWEACYRVRGIYGPYDWHLFPTAIRPPWIDRKAGRA